MGGQKINKIKNIKIKFIRLVEPIYDIYRFLFGR